MNIMDYAILGLFALFVLSGVYKGFLATLLSIGSYILSWAAGMLLMPTTANLIKSSESLYGMMLYYTEGSEYITDVEMSRASIDTISTAQLSEIISKADIPYPMGKEITKNVATEAFSSLNVTTLGDYFNQTIVCVFINILVFLAVFAAVRVILAFIIHGVDYSWVLPKLKSGDVMLGAGLGVIRGILSVFLIFMLLPIVLTVLGQFDLIKEIIDGSVFAPFFYHSNFLLSLIPGV